MPGRLRVRRPSPTTVNFTVSDASRRSSSPAKILFGIQILLRTVVFCCVILALLARLRRPFFDHDDGIIRWQDVWDSPLGSRVCQTVDTYNPWAVGAVSALAVYGVFRRGYTGMRTLQISRKFLVDSLTFCRRIFAGHPWVRHPDLYIFLHIPIYCLDEVYPHHPDSRYRDP